MKRAALLSVFLVSAAAVGQQTQGVEPESKPRVTVEKSDGKTHVVVEQDVSIKLDVAPKPSKTCAATIRLEYEQRNTAARASGTIDNTQCAASRGDYTLVVTVRDANGELTSLEFKEPWQRGDDQPFEFVRDYAIGDNVDLVRVRARGLHCTCDEVPPQ
jgi:hypothetical protein